MKWQWLLRTIRVSCETTARCSHHNHDHRKAGINSGQSMLLGRNCGHDIDLPAEKVQEMEGGVSL